MAKKKVPRKKAAKKKAKKKKVPRKKAKKKKVARKKDSERKKERSEILREFGKSTSDIIQKAASILEEEVAAGIVAAKEVERHMREDGDFRSDEFGDIMQRLRRDAHDMVNIISEQVDNFRSSEFDHLGKRFQKDAHDAVDIMLNVMNVAPDIINRLLQTEKQDKDVTRQKGKRKK